MNQKFSTGFDARPVESIARRRRSAVRRAALLAGGAVFLIALIILAALDAKLAWTPAARTALLVLAGAGALALGVQQWLRHRRGSSAADVVKLMEAQQPASGQQLRTAWEVSRKGLPSGATPESREFAGQLLAGAKQQVSSDNWSRLVPRGRVWKMLGLCGAAAAVMAVLANTWPDFRTSLRRLTMPAGAPDFTTVQWESVPSRFDDRHPPRLAVMLSGREAAPLLEVRAAGGAWEQKPLTPLPDGRLFDAVLTGLTKDFEARVTAGDGATPVHLVRYRPIPRLEEAKVTVHYPDYTGREPEERAGGDAGAVEGSTFEWQFAFNVAPDRVEWSLASENVAPQNIPMTMDGAKARARWTAPLGRFAGVLTVRDTDGEVIDSWKYAVAGAPDALPKVELLEPVKDSEATSVTELPVRIRARDDHGVAELGLVMEAAGQTIWTLEKVIDSKTDRDVTEMTRAMLETVPLTIRDNVKLYAYALDHKPRGGPRAVSALRAIDIRQFKKMTRDLGKVKGPPISPEQVVKLNEIIVAQRVVVSDCHVTKEESRNDSSSVTVKCQEIGTKQTGAQSKALLLQSAWQLEPSIPRDDVTLLATAIEQMTQTGLFLTRSQVEKAHPSSDRALSSLLQIRKHLMEIIMQSDTPCDCESCKDDSIKLEQLAKEAERLAAEEQAVHNQIDPQAEKKAVASLDASRRQQEVAVADGGELFAAIVKHPRANDGMKRLMAEAETTMRDADDRIHSAGHLTSMPPLEKSAGTLRDLADFIRAMEDSQMAETMKQMANKAAQDAKKAGEKPGDKAGEKPKLADAGSKPGQKPGDKPGQKPGEGSKPGEGAKPGEGEGSGSGEGKGEPKEMAQQQEQQRREMEQAARNTTLANEILKALEERAAKEAGQPVPEGEKKNEALNPKALADLRERTGMEKLAEDLKKQAEGKAGDQKPGELSNRLAGMSQELKKEAERLTASRLAKLAAARDKAKALREQAQKEQNGKMSAQERQMIAQFKAQGIAPGTTFRMNGKTFTIPKDDPPGTQPGNKPGSKPGNSPGEGQTAGKSTNPAGDANQQGGGGLGPALERFTVEAGRLNDEPVTNWTKQLETKVPELVLPALDGIVQRLDVLIAQLPGGQQAVTAQSRIPEASRREVEDYFKNLSDDFGDETH